MRDAERLAQQKKAKRFKTVKEPREKDADTKALARDLTARLGLKTEIQVDGGRGAHHPLPEPGTARRSDCEAGVGALRSVRRP